MPNSTTEEITEAGLTIIKHAFDAELMSDYAAECSELFDLNPEKISVFTPGENSPGNVETLQLLHRSELRELGYQAITRALECLVPHYKRSFNTNRQEPFSYQSFHRDKPKPLPLFYIYPEAVGALDYVVGNGDISPETAELDYKSIEVEAGSVVVALDPTIMHRGRNASSTPRITTVIY